MKHATFHPHLPEAVKLSVEWDRDVDGNTDTSHGELELWVENGLLIVEGARRGRTLVIPTRDVIRAALELTA